MTQFIEDERGGCRMVQAVRPDERRYRDECTLC